MNCYHNEKKLPNVFVKLLIRNDNWGLKVHNVELKDVSLPESMERTIAKQAEAEREKRAVIINSEGELAASANLAKAAEMLSSANGAFISELCNQLMTYLLINQYDCFVTPIEALKALAQKASKDCKRLTKKIINQIKLL